MLTEKLCCVFIFPVVSPLCNDGCAVEPCKHGGVCEELWQDERFKCDCSYSEYAGPRCNTGKTFPSLLLITNELGSTVAQW